MIGTSDLAAIDRQYFEVIGSNEYCITLRSLNTLHEWHLMERVANGCTAYVISHRHGPSGPYHLQRSKPTVGACCDYIMDHDRYHLEKVRKQKEQRLRRLGLLQTDEQVQDKNKK